MRYQAVTSAIAGSWDGELRPKRARESAAEVDDSQIIRAVRDGNSEAFGKLVKKYEDFVFTLIHGLVQSEEAAKDITQETFLRAYRGIRRFRFGASFKTWLYRIAFNATMSHLRRNSYATASDMGAVEYPVTDQRYDHALHLTMEKLIGLLKPSLRAAIIFHYYDDLKYDEISKIMNCPVGTVKIRLYRAKYELRKLWSKYAV